MKRKIQKQCLLNQSLMAEEIDTLEQLSKYHRNSDFRRRAFGLLALNEGGSVVETFLVLDNASMHHHIDPAITNHWLIEHRFLPFYLPPYSPELNLIEILWKHAKYHCRTFTSWTRDILVQEVWALLAGFGSNFHVRYA